MAEQEYTPTTEEVWVPADSDVFHAASRYLSHDDLARWLAEHDRQVAERAWDERDKARPTYTGPDSGHYEDCMGYEDCDCAQYPNPYRKGATGD